MECFISCSSQDLLCDYVQVLLAGTCASLQNVNKIFTIRNTVERLRCASSELMDPICCILCTMHMEGI